MSTNGKCVFWDWNCTLLDDAEVILVCFNIALKELAYAPISMNSFRGIQCKSLTELYRAAGVPEDKLDYALEHERDIFHNNYEQRSDKVPLRKGAMDLLHRLKSNGVSNVILSNHIADQIVRLLKLHDIHRYFDDVLAFMTRAAQFRDLTKSDRLRLYMKNNGLNPAHTFVVGDTVEEIEIAREFGMGSAAITGGLASEEMLRASNPDYIIHSLDELAPILRQRRFVE